MFSEPVSASLKWSLLDTPTSFELNPTTSDKMEGTPAKTRFLKSGCYFYLYASLVNS
jgi:hypothetical protein